MHIKVDREVEWRLAPQELRERSTRWAAANDFACISDMRDSWTFSRGTPFASAIAIDVRNRKIEAMVRHDPQRSCVYCSMSVSSPLRLQSGNDFAKLGQELDGLVHAIDTGFVLPTAQREGGLARSDRATIVLRIAVIALGTAAVVLLLAYTALDHFERRTIAGAPSEMLETKLDSAKPKLPVLVTCGNASMGPGPALQLQNMSDRSLTIRISHYSPTLGWSEDRAVDLAPNTEVELGWADDLKLAPGDLITLRHADYQRLRIKLP